MSAARRWGEALEGWAIPEELMAAAPESPWGFPVEIFAHRAARAAEEPDTPARRRAREALRGGDTVLDVGAGAGAASLPLVPPAARVVAVDPSRELLAAMERIASERGIPVQVLEGSWPEAATLLPPAEVVVCHHVLYNAADPRPFLDALTEHARRRVVVEVTAEHPLAWMKDLWRRFHDLPRPEGPTGDDLQAVLEEMGLDAAREDAEVPRSDGGFTDPADAVALVRRLLCLRPERDEEVREALGDRLRPGPSGWAVGPSVRRLVAFWWEP